MHAAWKALAAHYAPIRHLHLRRLFAEDAKRGERLTAEAVGLYLDSSKNRITDETLRLLVSLAEQSGLRERIDAMFRGERINVTERRAALHVVKVLAQRTIPELESRAAAALAHDSSTNSLIRRFRELKASP